jgi:hypothetical protein
LVSFKAVHIHHHHHHPKGKVLLRIQEGHFFFEISSVEKSGEIIKGTGRILPRFQEPFLRGSSSA